MARSQVPAVLEYGQGDTWQVGGSRFALLSNYAFNPVGYGQTAEAVPFALPSIPPVYGQTGGVDPTATASMNAASAAASSPLSLKASPLPWVIGGLFVAVIGLHVLHWSEREERHEEAA